LVNAERIYIQILNLYSHDSNALHLLGVIRIHQGRYTDALELIGAALKENPNDFRAYSNYALAQHNLKAYEAALFYFQKALALAPEFPEAFNNRGLTLHQLGRYKEALKSFDKAIELRANYCEAFFNKGNTLLELGDCAEAIVSYDKALNLRPTSAEILNNRGTACGELNRWQEALANFDKAIAVRPDYSDALNNRGRILFKLHRSQEALVDYNKAIFFQPNHVEALNNRGNTLKDLARYEEAILDFEKALALKPDHRHAFGGLADAAQKICDWPRTTSIASELQRRLVEEKSIIPPLTLIGYTGDPALQLECAKITISHLVPVAPQPLWKGSRRGRERLRIGYLSADFHRHATAFLMAELFERHDRSRFEVLGFSYGPDDNSDMRARLVAAFDQFHNVQSGSDRDVAKLLNGLEVDIAVDLKGLTRDCRPGILAHRPAPIQVSYLGYPGSMGADFIDYVIADEVVLPLDQQPFWTEKIVHLPDCYQVNDSKRKIAAHTPRRRDAGLPDLGFVFCSFNNTWKVTPPVFDIWMRLLKAIDNSVLWLLRDNIVAERNLRKEAVLRGIDPRRLVFAEILTQEEHLARQRLADLFLDTLPVNAHTTASNALWAGLPILTCCGQAFSGRVAASLLHAIGLAELVTHSLDEYEAAALRLALEPSVLGGLRKRLQNNQSVFPLFDTNRFRRNIEAAYTIMWERFQHNQSPQNFDVEPQ
jgi:predicted O-linked N-acetylglucosamine transferase (SPINDLY family)